MFFRHHFHGFPYLQGRTQPRRSQQGLTLEITRLHRPGPGTLVRIEHLQHNAPGIGQHKGVSGLAQYVHKLHHDRSRNVKKLGFLFQQQIKFFLRNGMDELLLGIDLPPARAYPG